MLGGQEGMMGMAAAFHKQIFAAAICPIVSGSTAAFKRGLD